jgi:hypothetical protein
LAEDLRIKMENMDNMQANFDKAGSTVTTGKENVSGVQLNVTSYKDKDGNILKVYTDSSGSVVQETLISAESGAVLTVEYNEDGTVAKETIFEPVGLKMETIVYNSDGTQTVTVIDASLPDSNTLTYQVDANGDEILGSATVSTSPGLPEGYIYCTNTAQYQEAASA